MKTNLIMQTLSKLEGLEKNEYRPDLPMDNLDQVRSALDKLGLKHKTDNKKRETIHIKYKNKLLSKYTKANYPNNYFLGKSICNNKYLTEYYLNLNNVPTPKSKLFTESEYNKAFEFIKNIEEPFVIKALNLRQGIGVFTNVNHQTFDLYWKKSVDIQKKRRNKYPEVLIQNQLDGLEVRINVIEGKVESAILRLQGYLIGNGQHTVEQLINFKNQKKKQNPYLARDMILFDEDLLEYIGKSGKNLKSILKENEMLILNDKPEIRYGMETYNVTTLIRKDILEIGLNAVVAIPGLHTAGVDIIIPHLNSDVGNVIEVNKNPAWALSLYAVRGPSGEPLKNLYESHLLDNKILNDEVNSKNDVSDKELEILINRFKFLFKKDQFNTNVIKDYHNTFHN